MRATRKYYLFGTHYPDFDTPHGIPLRTCSRSLRVAVSCVRTERRNQSLHKVNEDFEHRPSANGSGTVDLEQVLNK
jgi:hypothetical protein